MTKTNPSKKSGADKRDRRILPSRQRPYRHLHVRVDRLEDAISHFYNVINELRRHVSTLDKQLKSLAKDGDRPGSRGALAKGADHAA
jgi:predicted RNase H-like nuclease (RuvC/YqgF family)